MALACSTLMIGGCGNTDPFHYQIKELAAKFGNAVAESDHPEWVRRKRLEEEAQSERNLYARQKGLFRVFSGFPSNLMA